MTDLAPSLSSRPSRRWTSGVPALRTRLFELAVFLWSLPFGLVIITVFQFKRPPRMVRRALRLWSRGFLVLARRIVGLGHRLEGTHNVPDQPVIFVCNHQSYWESIAFTAFFPDLNVVTKAEAMRVPVFGWGLRHAPMIRVDRDRRGSNLRRLVREARKSLAEGRSILLFPEGTRVPPGGRRAYLRGLEMVYRECGVPVVPVVHNAGCFWTEGFRSKSAGQLVMRFFPSVSPGGDPCSIADALEYQLNREKDRLPRP